MKASNSKGDARTVGYEGGKIHTAVTDDGIPVTIAYTSASLHDSQAMIPLIKKASERVPHIHDLADAAYDSETIRESSVEEGNQPIIDCNRRKADEAPKMTEAKLEAYKAHGGRHVRVRDPMKVRQHLMYGVLVVVVEMNFSVVAIGPDGLMPSRLRSYSITKRNHRPLQEQTHDALGFCVFLGTGVYSLAEGAAF